MGENSKIEWTHHTFNAWTGCEKVSAGCANCYAESWAKRSGVVKWGPNGTRRKTSKSNWQQPMKWEREARATGERRRVFCASLADVFEDREELIPWRCELFDLIEDTPGLDWLLLTKRPENIARLMPPATIVRHNVWLGTSVESMEVIERAGHLASVPAAVRFLSCEPLLGPLDLGCTCWLSDNTIAGPYGLSYCRNCRKARLLNFAIHWVIVGGESGHHARAFDLRWARDIRDQCKATNVPCFVKQFGAMPFDSFYTTDQRVYLNDKKGGDWNEWPEHLRVRQFPIAKEPA